MNVVFSLLQGFAYYLDKATTFKMWLPPSNKQIRFLEKVISNEIYCESRLEGQGYLAIIYSFKVNNRISRTIYVKYVQS